MAAKSHRRARKASFHIPARRRMAFVPGQIALKFEPHALERTSMAARGRRAFGASTTMPSDSGEVISWLARNAGLKEIRPTFVSGAARSAAGGRRAFGAVSTAGVSSKEASASANALLSVAASPHEDLRGYTIAHVDPKIDVVKAAKKLQSANSVAIASPIAARWMLGSAGAPHFRVHESPQWALDCIGFREVPTPRRGAKVTIAVLDTGIDLRHPDLRGVRINYDHGSMRADDLEGHGTHVAGIISAIAARKDGMTGVSQCDLDVWKVFSDKKIDGERYVDSDTYNRALGLVLDSGCRVVNLSLGGTELDEFERDLVARLVRRGVTVVAAMGNEYEEGDPKEYPAALPGVIAVGGIDQTHDRAEFSNTGKHICVVAPAVAIRSTIPFRGKSRRARYADWDGTSFAAPQVSGIIGYLMRNGIVPVADTPARIRSRLKSRAVPLPGMRGKRFTRAFGYGLIDLPRLSRR